MTARMGSVWKDGTLIDGTPKVINMGGAPLPCTITLKSAAAGRKIEISTDDGQEYFTPNPDTSSATMQVLSLTAPVSHVRITGAANDKWSIR